MYEGDDDDGRVTEERAEQLFLAGAQAMREMLARFVEQGGDTSTAISIRANWVPSWGKDPGPLTGDLPRDAWDC